MYHKTRNKNNNFDNCDIWNLSDCCSIIIVEYDGNSTQVFDKFPEIFQEYEMQPETLNERPYYIGRTKDTEAIAFDNCGDWTSQYTSSRSALINLN